MTDPLSWLTLPWFASLAGPSIGVAFVLRLWEHEAWVRTELKRGADPLRTAPYALIHLPQCIVFGFAFGYLLLVIVAHITGSEVVSGVCACGLPGMVAFLAPDLREFIRRVERMR